MNPVTRLRLPIAGVAVAMVTALSACSNGSSGEARNAGGEPPKPTPLIKISPAKGTEVRPDRKVVVTAANGSLEQVTVQSGGKIVKGAFNRARTTWVSKEPLKPGSTYTVSATARGEGGPATVTSQFNTLKPKYELYVADVTPNIKGEVVGVGMPIMVTFNRPVVDKAAVERALKVTAEKPVRGAWRWINDRLVIYRPEKFWPAHQKVKFTANLVGVRGGPGMYGVKNTTTTINIGAAWISTVNVKTHTMVVKRDGKVMRVMKISAGKATTREYTTTSGIHLTMERGNPVTMISPNRKPGDPDYYKMEVNHAVRISNSGEYVHAAPWSVWAQGRANVSHGCINAHPDDAKWFYDNFHRGDVVKIVGTDRQLEWNNGWGFWQLSFNEWRKGSALYRAAASRA
ncbi:putative conserved lipoprotein LppS [Thermobispora bispora]|uniref:ErfK/YbiS/YcfS/YnhG family protein n=1 Tax=Thermobispora bispora (strain ATCC 19993 / DSM 43833 / CBS 139.67 / JCM 10125 / KCTC 9307 / NBRC 14880 / R51) TaxID=469371 RepID=D6YBB1_THEBD|nr:Ig-like domain-containing protein [Thermobispora bispora]ADG88471.1 ErfK/YbiS/YcfS/YnhG family protein [Thermobispora bispora DSM 43833]MDI9581439.1 Ig-like domain-containing protein [Thermobispora sp.]